MIDRIAQILEDLFDIPRHMVEKSDELGADWGLDRVERRAFDDEFRAEFGVAYIPSGTETIEDYARLIS